MRLSLYYPIRPHFVSQKWGEKNDAYLQFGFSRHNGIDIAGVVNGEPLYCPIEGDITKIGWQPTGAGNYVTMVTDREYEFDDGQKSHVEITFMHNKDIVVKQGWHVQPGMILAHADNTGFSTGPHSHMLCKRVKPVAGGWQDVDNAPDVTNTFDQAPYFNGIYADTVKQGSYQKVIDSILKLFGLK